MGRGYLVAYDPDCADWRVFRLDRVANPAATSMRCPRREPPFDDAVAYVNESIAKLNIITGPPR